METKELRIGNYIQAKSLERKQYQSPAILDKGYFIMLLNKEIHIKPIELTEDQLIKFGFYRRNSGYFKEVNVSWSIKVFMHDNVVCFALSNWKTIQIKYVHQLQNLYFALTQKELEFKDI